MKVLLLYHAGAMQNARCIFRDLARSEEVELTAVVPEVMQIDRVYDPSGWLRSGDETSSNGYRYRPIPLRDPSQYQIGFERKALRQVLRETEPDIIHVLEEPTSRYLSQATWERLLVCPKAKVLFYGFDNLPIQLNRVPSRLKWRTTWQQVAGGAAANSETLVHLKAAGFPADRPLERIFWGIDREAFQPTQVEALKSGLKLDCEHVVGFVGRLTEEKGVADLVDAIENLPASVHGLFIGGGPLRAAMVNHSKIHLLDVLPPEQLAAYINCMDVLAIPSVTTPKWKEQYGRVIAEAMSCGVPVVGSDSGAIPEVMGQAGIVFPERNVPALTAALHGVIFDSATRNRLRTRGLQRAENEFGTDTMARRFIALYKKVLGN